jgi:hypothetical protein
MRSKWFLTTAFAAALSMAGLGMAQTGTTSPAPVPAKSTASTKAPAVKSSRPTAQQIADAKAKGMVWVNTQSKLYYKEGSHFGKGKNGKFMTEDEAKTAGFKAAPVHTASKAKAPAKTPVKS